VPELTSQQIADLAAAPQSTTTDGVTVTERSADDVIKLDRFATEKAAATPAAGKPKSFWAGLRPAIAVPPGST
jgi:hypothetical protein